MRRVASILRRAFARTAAPRRTRLAVIPLESRAVPSTTVVGPSPTSTMPPPYPEVTGRVWRDLNADGQQEPGEPGIAFVTLQLFQGDKLVGTTTTDGLGNYSFNAWNVTNGTTATADDGLVAGTAYEVRVAGSQSALAGLRPTVTNAGADRTVDSDGVATAAGANFDFTMGGGAIYPNDDFGYTTAATIGGVAWNDANNNGIKDRTEAALPGVTVRLLDATGTTQVVTTTTATDGSYQFTGLVPGTYVVEIAATNFAAGASLAGYSSSTGAPGQAIGPFEGLKTPNPNAGKKGACDDGTMTAGGAVQCKPIVVSANNPTNNAVDFGFVRAGTLTGKVFVDANGNGQMDPEDTAGVAGVKVTASGPAGVFTTTTDSTGSYAFANLPAATYTVTEVPPAGYRLTTAALAMASVSPTAPGAANFGEARMVDLDVKLAASPAAVNVGGVVTLTYRVWNVGTLDATGITLTTPLPKALKVLSVNAIGATYDQSGQRATIPTLAAGAEAVITIRVRASRVSTYTLTGTVQGTQPEDQVANNRSSARFQVINPSDPPLGPHFAFLSSSFRHI
jgi:uncharacterized repeat protein (TIGR01451 family)